MTKLTKLANYIVNKYGEEIVGNNKTAWWFGKSKKPSKTPGLGSVKPELSGDPDIPNREPDMIENPSIGHSSQCGESVNKAKVWYFPKGVVFKYYPNPRNIKEWYKNYQLHREDGPAVMSGDGNLRKWYIDGKLHREWGPAIEDDRYGLKEWYINGKKMGDGEKRPYGM